MSLQVNNLGIVTKSGKSILRNCSWEVASGDKLGIIGESGSGKSMTALAIMGLLPEGLRATGSVTLNGKEILNLPEKALQKIRGGNIGMVFQEPMSALDPLMKVGNQIAGPIKLRDKISKRQVAQRVQDLLQMVALEETSRISRSYPWQLSGGQRQRVALAMALAAKPEILIADEPTTALDVTVQAEILDLLSTLTEETGVTLLFISHDLPVIAQITNEIVVMKNGGVVEITDVKKGLENPQTPYLRQLVTAAREVSSLRGGNYAK